MKGKANDPENQSSLILYQTEDGQTRLEVRLDGKSVWLTQKMMADLFQKDIRTINEHIQNIFQERELLPDSVIRKFRITAADGKSYETMFYNLETIIAVGYRVTSPRGTQFRIWATERLKEYLIKGFVMDDERLKEGRKIGADYFDELLERIRDIRASEKRFYQKVRDIYALSIDYDPKAETTQEFFQIVQNKLHWAITGLTAAELIEARADASKSNMGLTSWKGVKVRRGDVSVAKNYLSASELKQLNRLVTMYLDYAEAQAERRQPLYMKDWREKLDGFLKFNQHDILKNPGQVSMEVAKRLALNEYEKFHKRRLALEAKQGDDEFEKKAAVIRESAELKSKPVSKKKKK